MSQSLALAVVVLLCVCHSVFGEGHSYKYGTGCSDGFCYTSSWSERWEECGSANQSPINISPSSVKAASVQGPVPAGGSACEGWSQSSSEGVLQAAFACADLLVHYNGAAFTLQRLELHSPSEHSLGGGRFPAELQLYHSDSDGNQLAIAVFLQSQQSSLGHPFLSLFWALGDFFAEGSGPINPYASVLPSRATQYSYWGSQTAPSCAGVTWFVYDQPVQVSNADIDNIRLGAAASRNASDILDDGSNSRPTQPLGAREVTLFSGALLPTAAPTLTPPTHSPTIKYIERDALIMGSVALSVSGVLLIVVFIGIVGVGSSLWADSVSATQMNSVDVKELQLTSVNAEESA